ncbi:MAG: Stk1 family PASTA domain-containing Ser/Thr kinase [Clostridia bacterium]|nr:Stk1 family PASTA domain-containing Ser/Thr kinase [Clostridia bacterium]
MDKYIGKRLDGRYEIREIIGVGGMAYVYKAYDTIDDNIVAVKILKDEFLHNEEFSRRFKNESKAIAILSHRNIVRVNDVSFSDYLQYIVMEYIDGITLKEYIEQQRVLQWKEVVHFIEQILHALQRAHDKGIVHQDVKPQNIMLLADGTIKVTDFGIARFSRASVGQQAEQGDKAIGSVHYISPEQARAEITDEKSDIYSVGVMMYEMLTGRLPFESDNAVSVAIMQMQSVAERPTSINPDIPEGLEEITLKAMQKDPLKRYQSAAEMLYDIDEFKNNPSIRFAYQYLTAPTETLHYKEAFSRIRSAEDAGGANAYDPDDEDEEDEEKAFPLIPILAGVAGVILLIVLIVLGIFGINKLFDPDKRGKDNIEVPELIGQNYNTLMESGELADFTIVIVEKSYGKGDSGLIYDQSPPAGRDVKKGSIIEVKISLGDKDIVVPSIATGVSKETAESTLRSKGFEVVLVPETNDTIVKGSVIRIEPSAGTVLKKGSTVKVIYSNGPEPLVEKAVPTVAKRRKLEDAIKELEEAGFIVDRNNVVYVNDGGFEADMVVDQSPAGGEMAMEGTEIILTVVSGYKDVAIDVPMPTDPITVDCRITIDGSDADPEIRTGLSLLSNQSLSLLFSERKESYTVRIELARAGSGVYKKYAQYTLNGSDGTASEDYRDPAIFREIVSVPDMTGQTADAAQVALQNAGFFVSVKEVYSASYPQGTVVSQSPAGGADAMTGTEVVVSVAVNYYPTFTMQVDMPDDVSVDIRVYQDGVLYKEFLSGFTYSASETMTLTLDVQKPSYKLDVQVAQHGTNTYRTWRTYQIDGVNGKIKQ